MIGGQPSRGGHSGATSFIHYGGLLGVVSNKKSQAWSVLIMLDMKHCRATTRNKKSGKGVASK